MPFVIAEPCIGVKDKSCVEVCPVNCIYEGEDQYYIHPDECIDCQACEAACPVQAIFPDSGVPEKWKDYIEKNRVFFDDRGTRRAAGHEPPRGATGGHAPDSQAAPRRRLSREEDEPVSDTPPTREQALALLEEWIQNPNLRKHCFAVEAAMRRYSRELGGDEERWALTGLVHDFDWERHPDAKRHPIEGVKVLRERGWPEDVCRAVLGHASYTGVPRDTPLARALYAVDELCGFLVACALVTPARSLAEVEVPGVKKKMKRADFARNVNREDIVNGAAELGVDLDQHIATTLEALRGIRSELGL
jgi:putative nucleotidyltransferase with HDIG domain